MLRAYSGKVAVITGAGKGLGRALAQQLGARGCHLALIDIDNTALAQTAHDTAHPGIVVTKHCADVSSEESLMRAAIEVDGNHGGTDLLINNAGISASVPFARLSAADFRRIIEVNLFGAINGCRIFLPLLQRQGGGQILNVSSCFAWLGYPGKTAYSSSKAALRAFSESLRLELSGSGIGVTVLYPGPLPTSVVHDGISDSDERKIREEKFLVARGLRPERAAEYCLDRLLRDPLRIVIGRDYRLLDLLARVSPALASRTMQIASERFGF